MCMGHQFDPSLNGHSAWGGMGTLWAISGYWLALTHVGTSEACM